MRVHTVNEGGEYLFLGFLFLGFLFLGLLFLGFDVASEVTYTTAK